MSKGISLKQREARERAWLIFRTRGVYSIASMVYKAGHVKEAVALDKIIDEILLKLGAKK